MREIIIADLLKKVIKNRVWDEEPVFCFTSDIDWASEGMLEMFFEKIGFKDLKLIVFVTHESRWINEFKERGIIERGIHPNFLPNSTHGEGFRNIIEECMKFAPEAECFRSHRLFDVTNITHLLQSEYGYKYVSNLGTIMQPSIKPILHGSGLVHYPIFFEDGTHLYNSLPLDLSDYVERFTCPGLKIISVHPMNYVFNVPTYEFIRKINDSFSREEYNSMDYDRIIDLRYTSVGTATMVDQIIELAKKFKIMSLKEIYELTIS